MRGGHFEMGINPDEIREPLPPEQQDDAISSVVGSSTYVRNHRFEDLRLRIGGAQAPRLTVSRFYWNATPPTVIDFYSELRFGRAEALAKGAYCQERVIRYVLLADQHDLERLAQEYGLTVDALPEVADVRPPTATVATPDPTPAPDAPMAPVAPSTPPKGPTRGPARRPPARRPPRKKTGA